MQKQFQNSLEKKAVQKVSAIGYTSIDSSFRFGCYLFCYQINFTLYHHLWDGNRCYLGRANIVLTDACSTIQAWPLVTWLDTGINPPPPPSTFRTVILLNDLSWTHIALLKGMSHEIDLKKLTKIYRTNFGTRLGFKFFRGPQWFYNAKVYLFLLMPVCVGLKGLSHKIDLKKCWQKFTELGLTLGRGWF